MKLDGQKRFWAGLNLAAMLAGILFGVMANRVGAAPSPLEAGFAHPPREARPLVWWHWINGNITKEGIRADLEDMKRVGIGGVQMLDVSIYLPPGPVRYGSDAWHEHVQYAIRTAAELGLEFDIMNCPGWSASGGPWITPERSMKQLTWSETEVEGGKPVEAALARPPVKLDFYRDVAVLAVPLKSKSADGTARATKKNKSTGGDTRATKPKAAPSLKDILPVETDSNATPIPAERVLNLTNAMNAEGILRCELPAGRWTVLRFGFTSTGSTNHPAVDEGHGLEVDKLDGEAVAFQFDRALGRIIREAGPLAGKAFSGLLFDSFEGGFQNWTEALPELFRKAKGYDLTPWLPALTGRVIGSRAETDAFRRDFRGFVVELLAREYFGTMQHLAHAHGLKLYAEAQGGPLDPVICNEFTDVPMNEFWMPDAGPRMLLMKQIASVAGLLGKRIVAAESFTAKPEDGRWLATPATLKRPGDGAFTAGINRFIFHTYVHQPRSDVAPGFTLGRYGTHFGRLNTWWPYAGEWIDYLSRCQFLLQQGRTVADICILSDEHIGFPVPAKALEVERGFNFDVVYPRHLAQMTWKDGALRLPNGRAYQYLKLPGKWAADLATLRKLKELAQAGAPIAGSWPEGPAGLVELREKKAEWDRLWLELREKEILKETGATPDFMASNPNVVYIHRVTGEGDIYFISNQSTETIAFRAAFRVGDRVPGLWDPVSGRIRDAAQAQFAKGRVSIPVRLEGSGSVFVVFRRKVNQADIVKEMDPVDRKEMMIQGPWVARFQAGRGAPEKITMRELVALNAHADPGVRYFSGITTYSTHFMLPPVFLSAGKRALLDLGKVCDMAEVTLNGMRAGVAWTAPFALDVTGALHPGDNELEIAVANRWVNRLIGDESLPQDLDYATTGSKFTQGRLAKFPSWWTAPAALAGRPRFTFATWHFYEKDSPLVDSGLIGPVRLSNQ